MAREFDYADKKMALETIASLSDLLSSLLSSKSSSSTLPSPTSLKLITRSPLSPSTSSISSKSSQHLSMSTNDVINRVVYPSLANANLIFFSSGYYNVEVVPKDGESEDQLVNYFKRAVFRAGVLQECRRRRFFESSQEKKKRKTKEAAKKNRKRRPYLKPKPHSTPENPKSRVVEEEDDNWTLPPEDIEIPYTNRSN